MRRQKRHSRYFRFPAGHGSSLKYKLMIYFLLVSIIPLLLVGGTSYLISSKVMVNKVRDNSLNLIINNMKNFDVFFKDVETIVSEIATSSETHDYLRYVNIDNINTDESYRTLLRISSKVDGIMKIKSDTISGIVILPRKTSYPLFRGEHNITYLDDFSQLKLYQDTERVAGSTLWMVQPGVNYGKDLVTISKPIIDIFSGETLGVVVIYLSRDYLDNLFNFSTFQERDNIMVLDNEGKIVFHKDFSQIGMVIDPKVAREELWMNETGSYVIEGETKYIVAYSTSRVNNWKILYLIPQADITSFMKRVSLWIVIIAVVCGFITVLLARFIYKDIYQPIYTLATEMETFDNDGLKKRTNLKRQDELGRLASSFNEMKVRIGNLIADIEQEHRRKKELEIKALQAQIVPHFLYNTLNSIKALARLGRNQEIVAMIVSLLKLLRISLGKTADFITLKAELEYVQAYLRIMEFRYGDTLNVTYDIEDELLDYPVLKFIMQPIVENCIIHAFNDTQKVKLITVKAFRQGNDLMIEIGDNGSGMKADQIAEILNVEQAASPLKFSGMGIYNVNERLKLHYGGGYGIAISSAENRGTTVRLICPLLKNKDFE